MTVIGPPPKPDRKPPPPKEDWFSRELLWWTVGAISLFVLYWGISSGWSFRWPVHGP